MDDDITQSLKKHLRAITLAEESIRNHISTNRYQSHLIQNQCTWGQICSSLDIVGDTVSAISDYIETEYPKKSGLKYIYTYGILQTLFLQQDALTSLTSAFGYEFTKSDELIKIRVTRNASIGHPTNHNVKGAKYHNYISRMTMSKYAFTLLKSRADGDDEFIDVDILKILAQQLTEIEANMNLITSKLEEEDKIHKDKYKGNLLSDVFHSAIPYQFQKVSEGIYSPSSQNINFAISMLKSVKDTYMEFRESLIKRGEMTTYTDFDLKVFERAVDILNAYLSGDKPDMTDMDARIYHNYLQEHHSHFMKIAQEIDDEYQA